MALNQGVGEIKDYPIALDANSPSIGWGRVGIPLDECLADNHHYFVFAPAKPLQTTIVYEDEDLVASIAIAAGVGPDSQTAPSVKSVSVDQVDTVDWSDDSLVVWQGPLPNNSIAKRLVDFVNDGGTLWLLPPRELMEQGFSGDTTRELLKFRWTDRRIAVSPMQPKTWRADDGLLVSTQSGISLPVGELNVMTYATSPAT